MKNKSITYLLIAVVVAVWGGIFYKIFSSLGTDEVASTLIVKPARKQIEKSHKKESLILLANYRDPFLGTMFKFRGPTTIPAKKTGVRKPKVIVPVAVIDWSFASLIGIINSPAKKKKIAFLAIQGQERMLLEGEVVEGLSLIKIFKDSVKVSFQKQFHTYHRQP